MILVRLALFPFFVVYLLILTVLALIAYGVGWVLTGEQTCVRAVYPQMF